MTTLTKTVIAVLILVHTSFQVYLFNVSRTFSGLIKSGHEVSMSVIAYNEEVVAYNDAIGVTAKRLAKLPGQP